MEEDHVRAFLNLLSGLYQDHVIHMAEQSLPYTDSVTSVPMPNTCHPALTHCMDFVRSFNKAHVKVTGASRVSEYDKEELYPTSVDLPAVAVLTRSKAWGRAPFVGDPLANEAAYVWSILSDNYGRHIAGDSKLVWRY